MVDGVAAIWWHMDGRHPDLLTTTGDRRVLVQLRDAIDAYLDEHPPQTPAPRREQRDPAVVPLEVLANNRRRDHGDLG